jgi:hypothetical chaperone protein
MLGLDFGTTNSAVGIAASGGASTLARFPTVDGWTSTFRSAMHFPAPEGQGRPMRRPVPLAGPRAIESYLDEGAGGRFLQSLKSSLASRLFEETFIYGWKFTLEDLVAVILRELREAARAQLGTTADAVLIGRPVHFVRVQGEIDPEDDAFALARLESAARLAGFSEVAFEYEPVAAAFQYERGLDHDELVLIGDFGGGTSDFCLVELGPSARANPDRQATIRGVAGVPFAGDAFDGRIVRNVVAPKLGLGTSRRSEHGKELPIPVWIYSRLERWEDVSFLATPQTLERLRQLSYQAGDSRRLESLIRLVEDDLGYLLYREVERVKLELSDRERTRFDFRELPRRITQEVPRPDFEGWIEDLLARMRTAVDDLLARSGVAPTDVDRVFLTGGSSLVPSVRALFADRFGPDRLRGGEELTTVARGLALIAAERGR